MSAGSVARISRLTPSEALAYRALMLEAYAQSADAFTSTVAEREPLPLSWWAARMQEGPDAGERVLGAFVGHTLAGVTGLMRETREKTRHKATLFGMYVAPEFRGRGIAKALVEALLADARACPGLSVVQLTVTDGNALAQQLYERCGFQVWGVEPLATQAPLGLAAKVHMWRDLR